MADPIRVYRMPGAPDPSAGLPKIPTYGFLDTFTRANASVLGMTEDGKAWQILGTPQGVWGVESNAARLVSSAPGVQTSGAVVDGLTNNGRVRVVAGAAFQSSCGVMFRAQDLSNYLFVNSGLGSLTLWERVSGAAAQLATSPAGNALLPGDTLDIYLNGNAIEVWRNGTKLIDHSTSRFASLTRHGFLGYGQNADQLATRWASIQHTP